MPLLGLLVLVVVVLSGAPAAHRWLDRTAPGLAARLPRWARIGSPVRRRNRLRHRIVDGVVQRSRRDADGVLSLPDSVVVTLEPADREIVDRGFVDDLNREWSALAAAEGWSGPAIVAVEIVEGATGLLRRPCLALGYDEAPVAPGATADMRSDTATPLERGPFLVTQDNRWVSLPPRRSIVVGRGAVDVQVDADYVSRSHAELTLLPDGGVQVRDLQSANKTFVDGVEVRGTVVMRGPARIGLGKRYSVELRWAP